jgi:hypothetical protein
VNEVCRRTGIGIEPPDPGLIGELAGEDRLSRHGRLRLICRARNTTPMPPRASPARIW